MDLDRAIQKKVWSDEGMFIKDIRGTEVFPGDICWTTSILHESSQCILLPVKAMEQLGESYLLGIFKRGISYDVEAFKDKGVAKFEDDEPDLELQRLASFLSKPKKKWPVLDVYVWTDFSHRGLFSCCHELGAEPSREDLEDSFKQFYPDVSWPEVQIYQVSSGRRESSVDLASLCIKDVQNQGPADPLWLQESGVLPVARSTEKTIGLLDLEKSGQMLKLVTFGMLSSTEASCPFAILDMVHYDFKTSSYEHDTKETSTWSFMKLCALVEEVCAEVWGLPKMFSLEVQPSSLGKKLEKSDNPAYTLLDSNSHPFTIWNKWIDGADAETENLIRDFCQSKVYEQILNNSNNSVQPAVYYAASSPWLPRTDSISSDHGPSDNSCQASH